MIKNYTLIYDLEKVGFQLSDGDYFFLAMMLTWGFILAATVVSAFKGSGKFKSTWKDIFASLAWLSIIAFWTFPHASNLYSNYQKLKKENYKEVVGIVQKHEAPSLQNRSTHFYFTVAGVPFGITNSTESRDEQKATTILHGGAVTYGKTVRIRYVPIDVHLEDKKNEIIKLEIQNSSPE